MTAMLINGGNTQIAVCRWDGREQRPRVPVGKAEAHFLAQMDVVSSDLIGNESSVLRKRLEAAHEAAGAGPVVLASVLPELDRQVAAVFPDVMRVDHRSPLPFVMDLPHPEQVGPDRLCNVAAAAHAGLRDALVVDAGTATTFDLLRDGRFAGGLIAPGMAFALEKLADHAARLHRVRFEACPLEVGRETSTAMTGGAWHCGIGGVEHVINGLLEHYGDRPVILTGGLGVHLARPDRHLDPQWTLRGAAVLARLC